MWGYDIRERAKCAGKGMKLWLSQVTCLQLHPGWPRSSCLEGLLGGALMGSTATAQKIHLCNKQNGRDLSEAQQAGIHPQIR